MKQVEVFRLARQAGFGIDVHTGNICASHGMRNWVITEELLRLVQLVVDAERAAAEKRIIETFKTLGDAYLPSIIDAIKDTHD